MKLFFTFSFLIFSLSSFAGPEFGVLGGFSIPDVTNQEGSAMAQLPDANPSVGIQASLPIGSTGILALEPGLFYFSRSLKYEGKLFGVPVANILRSNHLEFPVQFRLNVIPRYVSLGAGVFGSYGFGAIEEESSIDGSFSGRSQIGYEQSQIPQFDWGAIASVQGSVPLDESLRLFLECRYQLGLTKWYENGRDSFRLNQFRAMAGAAFSF